MPRCVVKSCVYHKSANCVRDKSSIHLFRVPKDTERREAWRVCLNLEKEDIFVNSNVCHLHFTQESYDFEKSPFSLHLKQNALPMDIMDTSESLTETASVSSQPSTSAAMSLLNEPRLSTSTGFYQDIQRTELPQRSFTSLGFVENKTPPSSPIGEHSEVVTPRRRKLKSQLSTARKTIKRLRTSLRHFKKRVARLCQEK